MAVTVRVWSTGSVQSLCQAVFELFRVPVTARCPVSPSPVTLTDLIVPLVAVTVMPLRGSAPELPLAGVMLSWTVSGGGELLPEVPVGLPPEDDWQAAARMPTAQIAAMGASRRRFDRLSSCSTPSSQEPDRSHRAGYPGRFLSMPSPSPCSGRSSPGFVDVTSSQMVAQNHRLADLADPPPADPSRPRPRSPRRQSRTRGRSLRAGRKAFSRWQAAARA